MTHNNGEHVMKLSCIKFIACRSGYTSESNRMSLIKNYSKSILGSLLVFTLVACSSTAKELYFSSDGIQIHYKDSSSNAYPLVLLHGYSMNMDMWYEKGIATELAKDYRVIALDLRGHGASDKPKSLEAYGPKMGQDVINLLDHLNIDKAHMIGYSMGAFIVGRLLVTHPSRISSATLASGSFPVSNEEEEIFQRETAKHMEEEGEVALANVARGWAFDAVTEAQISRVVTPIQAVFGSEEEGDFVELQKKLLKLPSNALPTLIIEGADHDSEKAAVLQPAFLEAAKKLMSSAS